jgi:hypothetical protein
MIWLKIALGAAFGAAVGLLVHVLWSPALGDSCAIICHAHRATLAGALFAVGVVIAHHASNRDAGRGTIDDPTA